MTASFSFFFFSLDLNLNLNLNLNPLNSPPVFQNSRVSSFSFLQSSHRCISSRSSSDLLTHFSEPRVLLGGLGGKSSPQPPLPGAEHGRDRALGDAHAQQ